MASRQLQILLLCNKPSHGVDANTVVDHIEAFTTYSKHKIWLYSNFGDLSEKLDLAKFDAIVIHYSLSVLGEHYLSSSAKKLIRDFDGLKIIFLQDEYQQINKMVCQLQYLGVHLIYSCFKQGEIETIYSEKNLKGVKRLNTLTGYVPSRLLDKKIKLPPTKNRTVDVGYRGRRLPYWYGELSYEKWNIVEKWNKYVNRGVLRSDISYKESDRLYGNKWIKFLLDCKTTLGVESGASVLDFTGEIENAVNRYQLKNPTASFYDVQRIFLQDHEGKYNLNQISPRCFEAIALKTVLILYEGDYSGILIPNRHYIPLKKDFSNIDYVLDKIKDDLYLQEIANTAFKEIALNYKYSYKKFINSFDDVVLQQFLEFGFSTQVKNYYIEKDFNSAIDYAPIKKKLYLRIFRLYQKLPLKVRLIIKSIFKPVQILKAAL